MRVSLKNPLLFMDLSDNYAKSRNMDGLVVKPKCSNLTSISRNNIVSKLTEGFSFYKNFEYNRHLPVVEKFVLREQSIAKSLRYNFIETTKISLIGSMSKNIFFFPVNSDHELSRICSLLQYSRNKALEASLSHIDDIGGFFPNEKLELSSQFVRQAIFDNSKIKKIRLKCFPFINSEDVVAKFLNELGAYSIKTFPLNNDCLFIEAVITDYKPKITTILNHSYVSEISEPDILLIKEHYIRHDDISSECIIEKDRSYSYPKVGIIDSGVAEKSFLRKWEIGRELFVEPEFIDNSHGTFVTGRALSLGESFGGTEYLDVTVMPGKQGTPPDLTKLAEILKDVVPKYSNEIKIWNLSLGTDVIAGESVSLFAYTLDQLQRKYDILFVLPTGNYNPNHLAPNTSNNTITIPAESLFSLTVGSVSHMDTNITSLHSPSLFSRRGRGVFSSIKPELVYYGGTHEKRFGRFLPKGVFSIGKRNEIAEDVGTSHASPAVAATAAKIYSILGENATVDSVKALMVHKAHQVGNNFLYTGWGLPETADEAVFSENNTISILHIGVYKGGNYIETPPISLPPEMFLNNKLVGNVRVTLVYRPPVSINFAGYYTCANLRISLGYTKNGKWVGLVTDKDLSFLPTDKKLKEDFCWLPLKDYSAKLNIKNAPKELILRINVSKRDFWKEKSDIKYSVILSFESEHENTRLSTKNTISASEGTIGPLVNFAPSFSFTIK
jgi:hypothetical protein